MCVREDFGVEDTMRAADKVACKCGPDACRVEGARRLKRLMSELPPGDDWMLDPTEAGGDVD